MGLDPFEGLQEYPLLQEYPREYIPPSEPEDPFSLPTTDMRLELSGVYRPPIAALKLERLVFQSEIGKQTPHVLIEEGKKTRVLLIPPSYFEEEDNEDEDSEYEDYYAISEEPIYFIEIERKRVQQFYTRADWDNDKQRSINSPTLHIVQSKDEAQIYGQLVIPDFEAFASIEESIYTYLRFIQLRMMQDIFLKHEIEQEAQRSPFFQEEDLIPYQYVFFNLVSKTLSDFCEKREILKESKEYVRAKSISDHIFSYIISQCASKEYAKEVRKSLVELGVEQYILTMCLMYGQDQLQIDQSDYPMLYNFFNLTDKSDTFKELLDIVSKSFSEHTTIGNLGDITKEIAEMLFTNLTDYIDEETAIVHEYSRIIQEHLLRFSIDGEYVLIGETSRMLNEDTNIESSSLTKIQKLPLNEWKLIEDGLLFIRFSIIDGMLLIDMKRQGATKYARFEVQLIDPDILPTLINEACNITIPPDERANSIAELYLQINPSVEEDSTGTAHKRHSA